MSVELMVEVLNHAPPSLTPAEKLLLITIAESCNQKTRMTWFREGWDAAEVARRSQLTVGSLSKTFWSLAQKGCEVRVAHGKDKHGRPVFAYKGKQTTFLLPRFTPQRSDDGRGFGPEEEPKGPTYVGARSDEDRGLGGQRSDEGRTLLLKDLPSKNPSSLSPDVADEPPSSVPVEDRERDDDASRNLNNEPRTVPHRILAKHGCTGAEADQVIAHANRTIPKGNGWWRSLDNNDGDIPDLITEARTQLADNRATGKPPWCGHCDERTRQRTTEWMENISVSRCPDCHPLVVNGQPRSGERADFKPSTTRSSNQHVPYRDRPAEAYKTSKI